MAGLGTSDFVLSGFGTIDGFGLAHPTNNVVIAINSIMITLYDFFTLTSQ